MANKFTSYYVDKNSNYYIDQSNNYYTSSLNFDLDADVGPFYVDQNGNYYIDQNGNKYVYRSYVKIEPMFKKKSCAYIFINGQFKKVKPMIAKSTAIATFNNLRATNLVDAILMDENGNALTDENNQVLYTQILAPIGDCAFYPYIPKIF